MTRANPKTRAEQEFPITPRPSTVVTLGQPVETQVGSAVIPVTNSDLTTVLYKVTVTQVSELGVDIAAYSEAVKSEILAELNSTSLLLNQLEQAHLELYNLIFNDNFFKTDCVPTLIAHVGRETLVDVVELMKGLNSSLAPESFQIAKANTLKLMSELYDSFEKPQEYERIRQNLIRQRNHLIEILKSLLFLLQVDIQLSKQDRTSPWDENLLRYLPKGCVQALFFIRSTYIAAEYLLELIQNQSLNLPVSYTEPTADGKLNGKALLEYLLTRLNYTDINTILMYQPFSGGVEVFRQLLPLPCIQQQFTKPEEVLRIVFRNKPFYKHSTDDDDVRFFRRKKKEIATAVLSNKYFVDVLLKDMSAFLKVLSLVDFLLLRYVYIQVKNSPRVRTQLIEYIKPAMRQSPNYWEEYIQTTLPTVDGSDSVPDVLHDFDICSLMSIKTLVKLPVDASVFKSKRLAALFSHPDESTLFYLPEFPACDEVKSSPKYKHSYIYVEFSYQLALLPYNPTSTNQFKDKTLYVNLIERQGQRLLQYYTRKLIPNSLYSYTINAEELPEIHNLTFPIVLEEVQPLLPKILQITQARGHSYMEQQLEFVDIVGSSYRLFFNKELKAKLLPEIMALCDQHTGSTEIPLSREILRAWIKKGLVDYASWAVRYLSEACCYGEVSESELNRLYASFYEELPVDPVYKKTMMSSNLHSLIHDHMHAAGWNENRCRDYYPRLLKQEQTGQPDAQNAADQSMSAVTALTVPIDTSRQIPRGKYVYTKVALGSGMASSLVGGVGLALIKTGVLSSSLLPYFPLIALGLLVTGSLIAICAATRLACHAHLFYGQSQDVSVHQVKDAASLKAGY